MKFLIDMPLSPALADWLRTRGHDAVHAANIGLHNATDVIILDRASKENRIIVTADLDYPRLLAISGARGPAVILFRGGNYSESEMVSRLAIVLDRIDEKELPASFVVVDRYRVRKRSLPLK